MIPPLLVALFLVAHGLIHASFVATPPAPSGTGPQWPFDLAHSWALSPLGLEASVTRAVGVALLVVVVAGYVAAALSVAGLAPASLFVGAIAAASVASLVLLGLFFHPWLALGLVIDLALLWATFVAAWRPGSAGLA